MRHRHRLGADRPQLVRRPARHRLRRLRDARQLTHAPHADTERPARGGPFGVSRGSQLSGARGTRTPGLLGAIQALSQLSYSPEDGQSTALPCSQGCGNRAEAPIRSAHVSFRNRLALFFVLIVIVPMLAVAFLLFRLIDESERGKTDAAIAQQHSTAAQLFGEQRDLAAAALRRWPGREHGRDPRLSQRAAGRARGRARAQRREQIIAARARCPSPAGGSGGSCSPRGDRVVAAGGQPQGDRALGAPAAVHGRPRARRARAVDHRRPRPTRGACTR